MGNVGTVMQITLRRLDKVPHFLENCITKRKEKIVEHQHYWDTPIKTRLVAECACGEILLEETDNA